MKPIEKIRQIFTWLCLHPFDETTPLGQRILYNIFGSSVFISNVYALITSVAFFLKFLSVDMEECLFTLFQIFGYLGVTYATVAIFLQRNSISKIFQQLANIYKERKTYIKYEKLPNFALWITESFDVDENDKSFRFLMEASNQSEWIWRIYVKYWIGGFLLNLVSLTMTSLLVCWTTGQAFDVNKLYHPYKVVWVKTLKMIFNWSIWWKKEIILRLQFSMEWKNQNWILRWDLRWHRDWSNVFSWQRCSSHVVHFDVPAPSSIFQNVWIFT